jgi:hypothetical protein
MPETNAEGMNVSAVEETVQGQATPPSGAKDWLNLEADTIGNPGAEYKKMGRSPFSRKRQLRRPIVVGADAKLTLDVDVIKDHVDFFGEGIFMSDFKHSGGNDQSKFRPTDVTATGYTVDANGDFPNGSLVKAQGFENDENNGLKVLAGGSTGIEIRTTGLVIEDPAPDNAIVEFAGIQGIAGDLRLDGDGNLTSQGQWDFTTLGLYENQFIYLPHQDEVLDEFAFANAEYFGFAQIQEIAAGKLTLKRRDWEVGAADAGAGKTIQVFFTKWVRNVPRKDDDEALKSYQFELAYPDLAAGPADAYMYLRGYMCNMWTWTFSPENKATAQVEFIGMTASDPKTARLSGPETALDPVSGLALGTSTDFTRLSVQNADESGLMTDFVDLKIALKNNITPEKALATLGNRFTPLGTFEAEVTAEVFFTTPDLITAVRDNRKVSLATAMRNDDFGVLLDIPSMGVMETPQKIEHNRLVKITSKCSGYEDAFGGYTCGMSVFAHLPVGNVTTENT